MQTMLKCQVCGRENPPGVEYCEDCGASLTPAGNQPASAGNSNTSPTATAGVTGTAQGEMRPPDAPQTAGASGPNARTDSAEAPVMSGTPSPAAGGAMDTLGAGTPVAPPAPPAPPAMDTAPPAGMDAAPPPQEAEAPSESKGPSGAALGAALGAAAAGMAVGAAAAGLRSGSGESKNAGKPRLAVRRYGAVTGDEIPLSGERLVVGRFDPETGPVDIDLSSAPEGEQISRQHGELYREGEGQWFVRDLGSTNGVFVKGKSDTSFGPRITAPRPLTSGDELAFGNARFIFLTD